MVTVPTTVELTVAETQPSIKGATVTEFLVTCYNGNQFGRKRS